MKASDIPTPEQWSPFTRKALILIADMGRWAAIKLHDDCEGFDVSREAKIASKFTRLENDLALCEQVKDLIATRMMRVPAKNRPHYTPAERLQILTIKAARGWNNKQTADAFGLAEETIA